MRDGRMHQTTVRFGPDLWEALESECARLGVSAAQYVREAALARLAYTAGRRGDPEYDVALLRAGAPSNQLEPLSDREAADLHAELAQADASERRLDATALSAQNDLAMQRARSIQEESREIKGKHRALVRRPKP